MNVHISADKIRNVAPVTADSYFVFLVVHVDKSNAGSIFPNRERFENGSRHCSVTSYFV